MLYLILFIRKTLAEIVLSLQLKDENYINEVRQLLISAKRSYELNKFDSVYYYYNEASTFLGGMSNDENYAAAIVFANIATKDQNSKYKSMALDFLSLLHLRDALVATDFLKEPSFQILYKEKRWNELIY